MSLHSNKNKQPEDKFSSFHYLFSIVNEQKYIEDCDIDHLINYIVGAIEVEEDMELDFCSKNKEKDQINLLKI